MKFVCVCLLIIALTSVYAKSICDQKEDAVDQENPIAASTGAVSATQVQDENQRKYLEALFKINQAKIAQQMWNIFNSK